MNLFDRLKLAVGGIVGASLVFGWAVLWHGPGEFKAGVTQERAAAVARANDLIVKMEQDNAEISGMDRRDKCAEFGLEWVPDIGCR